MTGPLLCRSCATSHALEERFCPRCGTPLVYAPGVADAGDPTTEQHERARKVRPEYSQGDLVTVAAARNQAEAELIQGFLLEEGIPSLARRTGGFDVPDFLASGPRDILVPMSGAEAARDVLRSTPSAAPPAPAAPWVQVLAVVLVLLVLGSIAGALVTAVLR